MRLFLNRGVGGIKDEMTIYKHVFKKSTVSPTLSMCIGRSAFLFFYYCAY